MPRGPNCGDDHLLTRPGERSFGQQVLAKLLLELGGSSQAINLAEGRVGTTALAGVDELHELLARSRNREAD